MRRDGRGERRARRCICPRDPGCSSSARRGWGCRTPVAVARGRGWAAVQVQGGARRVASAEGRERGRGAHVDAFAVNQIAPAVHGLQVFHRQRVEVVVAVHLSRWRGRGAGQRCGGGRCEEGGQCGGAGGGEARTEMLPPTYRRLGRLTSPLAPPSVKSPVTV